MFFIGLTIGIFLGANISLFIYAFIRIGKESDRSSEYTK